MSTGSPPGHLAEMCRLDEEVGASLVATEAYMGTALDGPEYKYKYKYKIYL
jgi:hypothetical protein